MPRGLKLFGEKATASLNGQFDTARWRLTVLYMSILAIILFASSSITYSSFSQRLEHRFARLPLRDDILLIEVAVPQPAQVRSDLITSLIIVNGVLLTAAGLLSYWLAGLTLRPIQESYQAQRRFLADASHELRTPLAILQTTLENHQLRQTQQNPRHVTDALDEVGRMSRLVNDLLTLSRLEEPSDQQQLPTPIAFDEIVATSLLRLRPLAEKYGITLQEIVLPSSPLIILGQSDLLVHAVTNVLKNAILYNTPNGSVTTALRANNKQAVLTITDTGPGIAPHDLSRLTERFYRADSSRARQTGGSGLGLAITSAIVERFAGSLHITSTLGVGTTVVLTFPIHKTS